MTEVFITFHSTIASDAVADTAGNILQPAGKEVAEAIRQALGTDAFSEVVPHSFYGWKFNARLPESVECEILLQEADTWLLIASVRQSHFSRLFGSKRLMASSSKWLLDKIDKLPSVSGLRQYTREEYSRRKL